MSSVEQSSPGTELLAFLASITRSQVSDDAWRSAGLRVLDAIGCGIFGTQFQWTGILSELATAEASQGRSSLFGSGTKVSPSKAALCNGTAIHGYELDDILLGSLAHPAAPVVAAALAVAEHTGASGERLLLGVVAGYEIIARVGAALGSAHNDLGFHTTGITGPIAATVAACVVAGASLETMLRAVGIAASTASGLKAFTQGTGGMVKRLHAGWAAESGVLAWQFADRGFTGPTAALDGRFGMIDVFGGHTARREALSEGLGDSWAVERVWVKLYPSCGLLHTTAQAVETIRDRSGIAAADVATISIGLSKRAIAQNGDYDPKDTMTAQYSIPFCAALALVGDAKDPESYAPGRIHDADVRAMMTRVALHVDDDIERVYPAMFAARVAIETTGGERHDETVWNVRGSAAHPCRDDELADKFRRLARTRLGSERVERVIVSIAGLATGGSVANLSEALGEAG